MNTFNALGIVKNSDIRPKKAIVEMLKDFENLFVSSSINKAKVVALLNEYLPDFKHIETGKSLDQKM